MTLLSLKAVSLSLRMGKHEQWRDFLRVLASHCFRESIPNGTHFDMCIVDVMQFLAKMRSDTRFKPKDITDRVVRAAYDYSNIGDNPESPIIDKAVVLLIDTSKNVPKCKAATQIERDSGITANVGGGGEEEEEESPEEKETGGSIMTKEVYESVLQEMGLNYGDFIIHYDMGKVPAQMTPTMIWRSNNLKWQLNSMIVSHLLKNVKVPRHKVMIIDDGVVFGDPDAYLHLRNKALDEYQFHDKSEYEKEMLVSFLVTHALTQRYVLHHDGQYKRLPESGIGEADVKFGNYIMRESDGRRNPIRRYLIVSQDTDSIFILLAHMKRLIDPKTGEIDADIEVWIDSQMPSDKAKGHSRPYRYVNVKALYYAIIELFKVEYPSVKSPIETLLFMVNALDTDFTPRLGGKYLGVTRLTMWNVFSETHHQPMDMKDPGYITFSRVKKERSKVIHYSNKTHHLLGNGTISVVQDEEANEYRIVIDMVKSEAFLYLLCQLKLVGDMIKLKMITTTKPQFYYSDPDVLLIHTRELLLTMKAYKEDDSNFQKNTTTLLMGKKFVLPTEKSAKSTSDVGPSLFFTPKETQKYYDKAAMYTLTSKSVIPELYGIPTRAQMKGRLFRLYWVLNYLQNGTVSKHAATSYDALLPLDNSITRFGWTRKQLDTQGVNHVNLNSSYHVQSLGQVILGDMPIFVHATTECDEL